MEDCAMNGSVDWIQKLPSDTLIAEFSLWSANLLRLEDDLKRIAASADVLHIDVADGHFAPAMLFFPDLVGAIDKTSKVPIHVHLMVADQVLADQAEQFADAGADLISVHVENGDAAHDTIRRMQVRGVASGVVLQVDTPVADAKPFIADVDFVTLLGTAIGVKGQGLNEAAAGRLQEARNLIAGAKQARRIVLAADGGIREHTVPVLRQAGAETVVLGSLAFGAQDLAARMKWLRGL
jgi:ribulose-phosphate 3-epimerase